MHVSFSWTCVVLLLSVSLECTEGLNENKVFVEFSQNVPSENGMKIIENLQDSLQAASRILYNATGILLDTVTIDVPEFWNTSEWGITMEDYLHFSSSDKADILIDNAIDTAFGKFPFAQQYGSCGIPGHQIIVPTAFFLEENAFPKGISLAREWLKYRYGVFDENGYINDDLYPLYYQTPGTSEVHITECTNSKITYDFSDQDDECESDDTLFTKLEEGKCKFTVNEESLENVTSSFMYFQERITNMTHICGNNKKHPHNSRSPNKQNVLCYGKSIWDTISNSSDFKNENKTQEYVDPAFVFVKRMKPRVVVAWENTERMKDKGKEILNAITKLMIDLPDGSMFSAFPFSGDVAQNKEFKLEYLDGIQTAYKERKVIATNIKSNFQTPVNGSYKAAIDKARIILKTANEKFGYIIILTGTAEDIIVVLLKADSVCNDVSVPDVIDGLNSSDCLEMVRIPRSDEAAEIYKKLIGTLRRIYSFKEYDKVTETSDIKNVSNPLQEPKTLLQIDVDDYTENVIFSIYANADADSFELKLNEKKQGPKEEIYTNVLQLSYSPKQAGTIDLSSLYQIDQTVIEVQKTSKVGQYFTGEVIVQDTTVEGDTVQMPVVIYAIVRFGSYPIQNATVSAIIERPTFSNESEAENIELQLYDDGRGDPDITRNDGVYSRYFTSFSEKGDYTVTVTVSSDGFATSGVDKDAGFKSCCGSFVKASTFKMKPFSKTFIKPFTAISGRPVNGYKPSRITDLKIDKVSDEGVTLKFTAPGGEADSGKALTYEIRLFCEEGSTTECDNSKVIEVMNKPSLKNYGKKQQLKIKVIDKTQILSTGIITVNEKNKTSELSNIVEIFRPNETLPEITTDDREAKLSQTVKTGTIVGSLITGILIIICIIGVVIYFRRIQKDKMTQVCHIEENKDSHKTNSTFEAVDISTNKASVKKMDSFPVLLYTHDQIKDHKNNGHNIPMNTLNTPPKQWKSSDAISSLKMNDRDTKSLGSTSTIELEDYNDRKKNSE